MFITFIVLCDSAKLSKNVAGSWKIIALTVLLSAMTLTTE